MCLEAVVGKYAGLGKAIHAFGDLHHDHVVVDEGGKSILFDYIAWDPFDGDPHVLVLRHGGAEIKIFDVYVHVFCVGGGDDAVEMEFDGGKVGSGSGDFAGVDNFVAANGESDSVHVGFVWLKGCHDAEVGGNSALGFFGMFNETHGVGPRGGVGEATLGEAANFEGGAVDPFEGVGSLEKCWVFEDGAGVGVNDGEGEVLEGWVVGVKGNGLGVGWKVVVLCVDVESGVGRKGAGADDTVCSMERKATGSRACAVGIWWRECRMWRIGERNHRIGGKNRCWRGLVGCGGEFGCFAGLSTALAGVAGGLEVC